MATPAASIKGFLSIVGFIDPGRKATVRLGYLSDRADPRAEERLNAADLPPVVVSQLDQHQGLVATDLKVPANRVDLCPNAEEYALFAGLLPLASATRSLLLSWQSAPVASVLIPEHPPQVLLSWQPGSAVDGPQLISWQGTHPDGAPLEFALSYSHDGGRTFERVSPSISRTSYVLNFAELPGGTGQLKLLATDGGNTVAVVSSTFNVPIRPAHAFVWSPRDGSMVSGNWVTFHGRGYYLEEDKEETTLLEWTSSLDGPLGTGPVLQRSLSPGRHVITLAAGGGARRGTAAVVVDAA
jgi:hypothetical protein